MADRARTEDPQAPTARHHLVGLATAVSAVVARVEVDPPEDGSVSGEVELGRGGMICNTLAVSAALGVRTGGVVAIGQDSAGDVLHQALIHEGVQVAPVRTERTPVTVTVAVSTAQTRRSVMGVDGRREQHLDPDEIASAWRQLRARPVWAMLTLPALDSPAGRTFTELARSAGAAVAVTLSSVGHVEERGARVGALLTQADLTVGNRAETEAALRAGGRPETALVTDGAEAAAVLRAGRMGFLVPRDGGAPLVADTTGAGDAFAAGALSLIDPKRMAEDEHVRRAVLRGHEAARVIIGRLGAQPGRQGAELLAALGRSGHSA